MSISAGAAGWPQVEIHISVWDASNGYTGLRTCRSPVVVDVDGKREVRRDHGGDLDQGGVEMIQMCLCGLVTELGVLGPGGGDS